MLLLITMKRLIGWFWNMDGNLAKWFGGIEWMIWNKLIADCRLFQELLSLVGWFGNDKWVGFGWDNFVYWMANFLLMSSVFLGHWYQWWYLTFVVEKVISYLREEVEFRYLRQWRTKLLWFLVSCTAWLFYLMLWNLNLNG